MKPVAIVALLVCHALALSACSTNPQSASADSRQQMWESERLIVVTLRNERAALVPRAGSTARTYAKSSYAVAPATLSNARAVASTYKLTEITSWPIGILGVHCLVYALPDGTDRSHLLDQLRRDARVESAQPLNSFQTLSDHTNDPYNALQTNLEAMNVYRAHRWSHGEGIRIAIIDTHIDRTHPDLVGRIASQRDFVGTPQSISAAERHGTAVAGVIAANANNALGITGIAPAARILAFRACWRAAQLTADVCNTLTLAKALVAAIDSKADIVNLSLSGPADGLLKRLVRAGLQRGMFFVGAVPPVPRAETFPTSIPGVIAVDVMDTKHSADAAVFAPGDDILTLSPNGSYDFLSGSSIAAASVSGALALLLAQNRELTSGEAKQLLSVSTTSASTEQPSTIDLCLALTQLRKEGSCDD